MKNGILLVLLIIGTLKISAQDFGVIADSIRINLVRDSINQNDIDSMLFYDSLSANANSVVNWKKDDECSDCNGKYCQVRKIKNGSEDLDFCNSSIPYIPVFQEYFNNGIDPLVWYSAKSQEYSDHGGNLYVQTYPDGFGYYDHQRCDYFEINQENSFTLNSTNYKTKLMSVYNSNFPDVNSLADRNSKAAENNTIQQWYSRDNVVVENGVLKLLTKYEPNLGSKTWWIDSEIPALDENNQGVLIAPGKSITKNQTYSSSYFESAKYFEYGMFQAKITIPNNDGLWPAFWLMGGIKSAKEWDCGVYYEELDIFEFMGNDDDKMITTIHGPARVEQQWASTYTKTDYFLHPHVYTCYWTDCGIWIFLDEGSNRKKVLEYHHYPGVNGGDCKIKKNKNYYKNLRYPTQPMRLTFNTAVYSCQNLKPLTTGFPVSMDVEWVKVFYQRPCIEVQEISNSDLVNDINQELYNVWSAKTIKVTGNETFLLQSDNVYVPSRVPMLKVIVENEFQIESTVDFEIGKHANFYTEFNENICYNYGSPQMEETKIKNTQTDILPSGENKQQIPFERTGIVPFSYKSNKVLVYPNPANLYLLLEIEMQNQNLSTSVAFLKLDGTQISTFNITYSTADFYIGNLPDGVYVLRTENDEIGIVNKLVTIVK